MRCHIIVLNIHATTEDKNDVKDSFYEEMECVFMKCPKYLMEILLDSDAKVSREHFFKLSVGNESVNKISNEEWCLLGCYAVWLL
jgi:hypothetical protein